MAPAANDPPSATTTNPALCGVCPKPAPLRCSRCGNMRYCSTECQTRDWSQHKTLCATFKDFQDRPSEKHYRTIHFPVDGDKPRFAWVEHYGSRSSGGQGISRAELAPYVAGTPTGRLNVTHHCGITPFRAYNNMVIVELDYNMFANRQPVNQCLLRMVGPHARRWLGGYLAHAFKYTYAGHNQAWMGGYYGKEDEALGEYDNPLIALDLDTTSLGLLIAYFSWLAQQEGA